MSRRYRWKTPYEWLAEQAQGWDETRLRKELLAVAAGVGSDHLQEDYEDEMAADGYFERLHKKEQE